ncbi:hypothetical protein [Deinococcus maricopensis]|uniref:Uncharacterized protein n=1 Tax=Deinococcus maricopensis (strain DSM 21211 / LMG 22137 / NRRL B-23946 / LB-34) TaxID=709986 RepID=E8U8E8_DEIML|nr:hypothetical protein [Deinococcus maricopensis]ADV67337.1 hypothetical protein Deima_1688 [Deinococcus maricopensis DSM 21211]
MKHPMTTLIATAALTLGLAGAQTQPAPTTTVPLPGKIPASVTRTQTDTFKAFLAAGGTVQLLGADGQPIGTVNADGTVTLTGTATLADAKSVRVTPPTGTGTATTYTLARDLSKPGAIKLAFTQPDGRTLALPLSAIANRQANANRTDATEDRGRPENAEKPEKPEKPERGEKPGKGHK